jgi:ankyrin repeat protein
VGVGYRTAGKPEEITNEVLLSKDNYNRTPWHIAAIEGNVEVLKEMWDWDKNCS